MLKRLEVKKLVDEWLKNNADSIPFNIVEFCDIHNLSNAERDHITKYFRTMCRKIDSKKMELDSFSKEISKLTYSENNEGINRSVENDVENQGEAIIGEKDKLKRNFEERFANMCGCSQSNWVKLSEE